MDEPAAVVTDPGGPSLPPPPPPPTGPTMTFGLRPVAVAGLCLLVAGVAAFFAYKTLWPWPERHAAELLGVLVVLAGVIGLVSARFRAPTRRRQAVVVAIVVALAIDGLHPRAAAGAPAGARAPGTTPSSPRSCCGT